MDTPLHNGFRVQITEICPYFILSTILISRLHRTCIYAALTAFLVFLRSGHIVANFTSVVPALGPRRLLTYLPTSALVIPGSVFALYLLERGDAFRWLSLSSTHTNNSSRSRCPTIPGLASHLVSRPALLRSATSICTSLRRYLPLPYPRPNHPSSYSFMAFQSWHTPGVK